MTKFGRREERKIALVTYSARKKKTITEKPVELLVSKTGFSAKRKWNGKKKIKHSKRDNVCYSGIINALKHCSRNVSQFSWKAREKSSTECSVNQCAPSHSTCTTGNEQKRWTRTFKRPIFFIYSTSNQPQVLLRLTIRFSQKRDKKQVPKEAKIPTNCHKNGIE